MIHLFSACLFVYLEFVLQQTILIGLGDHEFSNLFFTYFILSFSSSFFGYFRKLLFDYLHFVFLQSSYYVLGRELTVYSNRFLLIKVLLQNSIIEFYFKMLFTTSKSGTCIVKRFFCPNHIFKHSISLYAQSVFFA